MLRVSLHRVQGSFTLDANFEAPVPGVIGIFGPSGCGKSTLLGGIAGTLRMKRANVEVSGTRIDTLPADHRGMGVVFQDGRLFPHLNVQQNLAYGMMRAPPGRISGPEVADLLGLNDLLTRMPRTLSGGERQRVAIGRALLSQPRMLLMDEPLASLDAARRQDILPYLRRLRQRYDIPIVYVSHSLEEITEIADTLVLMQAGSVLAVGGVGEIVARADLPIGQRDDATALLIGKVSAQLSDRRLTEIACGRQMLVVPEFAAEPRTSVRVRVRARDVILAHNLPRDISIANSISATVTGFSEDVEHGTVFVELDTGGGVLIAHVTADSANRLGLHKGLAIYALIKATAVEVISEAVQPA